LINDTPSMIERLLPGVSCSARDISFNNTQLQAHKTEPPNYRTIGDLYVANGRLLRADEIVQQQLSRAVEHH
jgi:hypothetical protein